MRILILGASGYVGKSILPFLINKNYSVKCLVRNPDKIPDNGIEVVQGDATEVKSIESVMPGCDTIIYLIHSMKDDSTDFEEKDKIIATNVANAASKHKIKKIIYLGGLGKKNIDQTPHLRSRHEVGEILRASGVSVIELRAGVIIGKGSSSFDMIKALVSRLPIMICPKWVNVKTQPIAISDVLEYILLSISKNFDHSYTIDIGGTTILSYREMMVKVAKKLNLKRLIITVPVLTPWLSSHWVNLVTTVSAPLARSLIESVRSETICENNLAKELFDYQPISFEEAISYSLE